MPAEIINLRRARKAKQRSEAEARAEENRTRFGRSKAEKATTKAEQTLATRRLDAARRERGKDEPEA